MERHVGGPGAIVFDVRPKTAHTGEDEIHPNVVVRYFAEPNDGGVVSASLRELGLAGEFSSTPAAVLE